MLPVEVGVGDDLVRRWCAPRAAVTRRVGVSDERHVVAAGERAVDGGPDAGVGRLVVAGAESDACIRSTIHGAFARGYDVTLVGDAHTCGDKSSWGAPPPGAVIAHTNLYWSFQAAPGRTAGIVESKDVDFA